MFDTVGQGSNEISIPQVEFVVKNVIGETDKRELDYIFKNIFRLDLDNNGMISFNEFSNFFLRRHCGEISLQRAHKLGLIGHGSERKLTSDEFLALLHDAYSFLKVDLEREAAKEVFKRFDTDHDNMITYVQYFNFIDRFIVKSEATLQAEIKNLPIPAIDIPEGPEVVIVEVKKPLPIKNYQSRLRYFLWGELRALFDSFDVNYDGKLQIEEARNLIRSILKLNTPKDIDYVLFNIFHIAENGEIDFINFATYFIQHVAEMTLNAFLQSHAPGKKTLSLDEFIKLFRNTFYFLNVSRIKDELLAGFFRIIDTDHDGLITIIQYLDWVKNFLCPAVIHTDGFYFDLDDMSLALGNNVITAEIELPERQVPKLTKFKFSDIAFAKSIRAHVMKLIERFDRNKNYIFEESEVIDIMQTQIKESEIEVIYVIHNVFRYDKDNDNRVTYPEMTNFLLEMHCGEMAIQRRHLRDIYKYGPQRMMDEGEFILTLQDAFAFLDAVGTKEQLSVLFRECDLDKDNLITYKEYFEFLTLYFGSESIAASEEIAPLPKYTAEQEFAKWLNSESSKAIRPYQLSSNLKVDENTLANLLKKIFRETDEEVDFVLRNIFRLLIDPNIYITDDDLRKIIVFLHVGIINLLRGHKAHRWAKWNEFKLNKKDFIDLVLAATEWASVPADPKVLSAIFDHLDTNRDGYITYKQYLEFIRSCVLTRTNPELDAFINSLFSRPREVKALPKKPMTVEEEKAERFYSKIWEELRALYNSYLTPGHTTMDPINVRKLIIEVLKEVSKQEHDYVFWNFFRLDRDGDGHVTFEEFVSCLLFRPPTSSPTRLRSPCRGSTTTKTTARGQ